jgi:hypothetical protein
MNVLLLWVGIVASGTLVVWIGVVGFVPKNERMPLLCLLLGISAIAATAGVTGGLSRDGAVGEVIAAALGLLGGVVVYVFGVDRSKGMIASICAFTFSLTLVVAYFEAAARRGAPESYAFWRERCIDKYIDKDVLGDDTAFVVMDQSIGELCAGIFTNENRVLLTGATEN